MVYLVGFGYAKPIRTDARYFNNPKRDSAIVAFAGPFSNLIVALVASLFYNLIYFIAVVSHVSNAGVLTFMIVLRTIFYYVSIISISLALYNLLPIPPLDGSKVVGAFLSDRAYYKYMQYERYFMIFFLFILVAGTGFTNVLSRLILFVYNCFDALTALPFNLILG